jgi:hypothetical protein
MLQNGQASPMLLLNLAWRSRLFTQSASNAVTLLGGSMLPGAQLQIEGSKSILTGLVLMGPEHRGWNVPPHRCAQSPRRILFWRKVRAQSPWN